MAAPSSEDAIAAFPGSGTYSTVQPLGVPAGYTTPITDAFGMTAGKQGPSFFEGDDWKPAGQSPERIARVQQQLVEAGLLTGSYRIGLWDDASRKAYRDVLSWANASGVTDDAEALQRLIDTKAQYGVETPTTALPPVKVTNPEDLKTIFRSAAKRVLGTSAIDDTDLERMVQTYQGQQAGAQNAYQSATASGAPVTDVMDPTVYAEQQARELDPVKADARKKLRVASVIENMLTRDPLSAPAVPDQTQEAS